MGANKVVASAVRVPQLHFERCRRRRKRQDHFLATSTRFSAAVSATSRGKSATKCIGRRHVPSTSVPLRPPAIVGHRCRLARRAPGAQAHKHVSLAQSACLLQPVALQHGDHKFEPRIHRSVVAAVGPSTPAPAIVAPPLIAAAVSGYGAAPGRSRFLCLDGLRRRRAGAAPGSSRFLSLDGLGLGSGLLAAQGHPAAREGCGGEPRHCHSDAVRSAIDSRTTVTCYKMIMVLICRFPGFRLVFVDLRSTKLSCIQLEERMEPGGEHRSRRGDTMY